jgi:hypothetical protein
VTLKHGVRDGGSTHVVVDRTVVREACVLDTSLRLAEEDAWAAPCHEACREQETSEFRGRFATIKMKGRFSQVSMGVKHSQKPWVQPVENVLPAILKQKEYQKGLERRMFSTTGCLNECLGGSKGTTE